MEKSEGRKQGSSPGSSSRRTYSLFSSIINLSTTPGAKITDGSSPQSSPNNTGVSARTYHDQKATSSEASKKKKGNQSSSANQPIGSCSSGINGPIGPAPRTLSILAALNELAISDQTGVVDSAITPDSHHLSRAYSIPSIRIKNDIGRQIPVNSNFYHKSSSSEQQLTTKVKRDDFQTFSSMPRKLRTHDKVGHSKNSTVTAKRSKSKEQTPDWIWKIFQLAKHGRLDELQQSLKGLDPLDPTLIRHLVDGKGNTLLHYAAREGHVHTLQWLVSILGSHTDAVLNDKNRAGRSVILTALKGGQLQCFQWLVLQTICGDKALVAKEGERSLLHFAANYKNEAAVKWLSEQLNKRNIDVDIRDSGGMTPLHMAGRSGSISVCHELINAGASPLAQTELGWRPSDLALRHRHIECANYLMMSEAAGSLGNELCHLLCSFKNLRQEHESLRLNFREVLRVGKWLVKERVDLIKSFPSKSSPEAALLLGGASGNGARFSALEHKLLKAEQAWKKMEQNQVDKFSTPSGTGPTTVSQTSTTTTTDIDGRVGMESSVSTLLNADFSLQNINSPDLLRKRLASFQSRRDRSFTSEALLSASSSEAESSSCGSSSSDDDHPSHRQSQFPHLKQQSNRNSSSQQQSQSHSAPWLLRPDDSLLSHISPVANQMNRTMTSETTSLNASIETVPTLDLLRMAPSNNSHLFSPSESMQLNSVMFGKNHSPTTRTGGHQSPKSNPSKLFASEACEGGQEKETPSAAVLEVIEPLRSPNKKGEEGVGRLFVSFSSLRFPWSLSGSRRGGKSCGGGGGIRDDCDQSYEPTTPVNDRRSSGHRDRTTLQRRSQECQLVHFHIPPSRPPPAASTALASMRSHPGDSPVPVNAYETMKLSLSSSIENERKQTCRSRRRAKFKREDDKRSSPLLSRCSRGFVSSTTKNLENVYFTPDLIRGTRHNNKTETASINESIWIPSAHKKIKDCHSVQNTESDYEIEELSCSHTTHLRQSHFVTKDGSLLSVSDASDQSSSNLWNQVGIKSCLTSIQGSKEMSSSRVPNSPGSSTEYLRHHPTMGKNTMSPVLHCSSHTNSKTARSCENLYSSSPVTKIVPTPSSSSTPLHHVSRNHGATFSPVTPPPPSLHSHPSQIFSCDLSTFRPHSGPLDDNNIHDKDERKHHLEVGMSEDNSENHTCGPSHHFQVPNDSVSSTNTPLMTRSLSCVSRESTTLVFPLRKAPWTYNDLPTSTTPESSLGGRLSPSPSEASKTESALVPPSHTSQLSEISKTESAQEPSSIIFLQSTISESATDGYGMGTNVTDQDTGSAAEDHEMDNCTPNPRDDDIDKTESDLILKDLVAPAPTSVNSPTVTTTTSAVAQSHRLRKEDLHKNNPDDKPDVSVDEDEFRRQKKPSGIVAHNIQTSPCMIRSRVSTGIHKTTIHRVTKGARGPRGPPKPWYEIDGSDEEGSHLLRVARSSRSSCLSSASPCSTDSENESETSDEHGCGPTCPQHNCPDFV